VAKLELLLLSSTITINNSRVGARTTTSLGFNIIIFTAGSPWNKITQNPIKKIFTKKMLSENWSISLATKLSSNSTHTHKHKNQAVLYI
jgi:hypothetical protein